MTLFRARSIHQLTIIGFMAVAALLVLALLVTARELDRLTEQGQTTVAEVATAISAGRRLNNQALDMERNALQYLVLQDDSLYQVYSNRRESFRAAAAELRTLDVIGNMTAIAGTLLDTEADAFALLSNVDNRSAAEAAYTRLSDMTNTLSDTIELWISERQNQLRERSESTRQSLTLQALLFIAAASALAALFIVLITRPLQQIDRAINSLGSGAYDKTILITGPSDLRALGRRLDWLRSRLDELEQQRASFLRHISHELKTPLTSMQEGAALLDEEVVGPLNQEQRDISRIIINNSQRLQTLIEDILRHNSQNFEVLNAMPEPVHFDQLIETVVTTHQWSTTASRIKIHQQLEKLVVLTDRDHLRVVIDNLFTNALKFSPIDSVITLRLFAHEDLAIFQISDEGPGIPHSEWEQVFTAFYQGSLKPQRADNGTGLGLAIARDYIVAAGGSIKLCETRKGACFQISLPMQLKQNDNNQMGGES